MRYRIPELDEIGQRIQQIVQEKNPKARLVQICSERTVAPVYRNAGSEYLAFVALPKELPRLCAVDIEKGIVIRTYG